MKISAVESTFIIAEIGVNHNGDIELAKRLVQEAKKLGADAVKFQTFTAEALVGKEVPKVAYQMDTTHHSESHYDMIKKLELTHDQHRVLFRFCQEVGIEFLSTPYDVESAKFLSDLGVRAFKTASADLIDVDLHRYIANTGKIAYVSVGMATLGEIEKTLQIYDQLGSRDQVTLLHCVSNYPCAPESLNLSVLNTLKQAFQTKIGYSDHAEGFLASCLSLAYGSTVIEKHFTLDKTLPGPDHKASCSPEELKELIDQIRLTEKMIGNPIKRIQPEEENMRRVSRKSLTVLSGIDQGKVIEEADLVLKRPGTGIPGESKSFFVGKKVRQSLGKNHLIRFQDVE